MEWYWILLLLIGGILLLMATGMPVALAFIIVDIIGAMLLWGGGEALVLVTLSMYASVASFVLLPMVMFTLMGAVLFDSGIAPHMIDAVDKWLGKLPGRLGLLTVASGTVLATLTGSDQGSAGILAATILPEIQKRGYKKSMSLGPILGSGGLAQMIPPTGLGVFLAAIAMISVGKFLIAIIIPGIIMAILYASYIVIRCYLQPSIAPAYDVSHISLREKLMSTVRYILPVGFIIFMVIGTMLMGIATPTQASATGALSVFILAAAYKRLNWSVIKSSSKLAIRVIAMMLAVMVGARAFGQIMAYTGASVGMIDFALGLPVTPLIVIAIMQGVILFLGCFLNIVSVIMITIPIFMPIVSNLGFDPVWFAVMYLLNVEMATTTPPYGMTLFVVKALAPPDTTMGDIYRAGLPFLGIDLIVMVLILTFPPVALWLPSLMR